MFSNPGMDTSTGLAAADGRPHNELAVATNNSSKSNEDPQSQSRVIRQTGDVAADVMRDQPVQHDGERRARSAHINRCRNALFLLLLGVILSSVGALLTYLGDVVALIDDTTAPTAAPRTTTVTSAARNTSAETLLEQRWGVAGITSVTARADTDLKIIGPFILSVGAVMSVFGVYYTCKVSGESGWRRVLPWSGGAGDDRSTSAPGHEHLVPIPDMITSRLAVNPHSPVPDGSLRLREDSSSSLIVASRVSPACLWQQDTGVAAARWYQSPYGQLDAGPGGSADPLSAGYQPLSIATQGTMYTTPLQPRYRPAYDTEMSVRRAELPIIMSHVS